MSKVKIFVVYHKPARIFKNEVFEPIQTGADFSGVDLGFLKDNTGDNIAHKNPNYGEMTAWYWVWKNWLPAHPETEYVGFCHYRRFLDVSKKAKLFESSAQAISTDNFDSLFKSNAYAPHTIESILETVDIVLPPKLDFMSFPCNFSGNIYDHYARTHPISPFIAAARIFGRGDPLRNKQLKHYWLSSSFHACLNFVMRRCLFEDFTSWAIGFANKLEEKVDLSKYTDYYQIRSPAFLVERYFDLWLKELCLQRKICIRTSPRWILEGSTPPSDFLWYLSGIKQALLWKLGIRKHTRLPSW